MLLANYLFSNLFHASLKVGLGIPLFSKVNNVTRVSNQLIFERSLLPREKS